MAPGSNDGLTLTDAIRLWSTPRSSENENRTTKLSPSQVAGKRGRYLATDVIQFGRGDLWYTPLSNYRMEKRSLDSKRQGGGKLRSQVSLLGLCYLSNGTIGPLYYEATEESSVPLLNPHFEEWLMGLPVGWSLASTGVCVLVPSATVSSLFTPRLR